MIEKDLFKEIIKIRRDLHQNPETGFEVERTAGIVADHLREAGISVKTGIGKTGVIGDIEVPQATKRIAFRADMDALPMQEERDWEYQSLIPGKAHMCGHDAHTAILIGAAKLIAKQKEKLSVHVRFLFQPNEEQPPGGASGMIQDGALDGVDEIYGLHVWPWLPTGQIGICEGPFLAQSDRFSVKIKGEGSHAAAPHLGSDPIIAGSYLVSQLQSIVSRNVDPLETAVLTVTQFHAGSADNVIPGEAILRGTVRTYSENVQKLIQNRMEKLIQHCGTTFAMDCDFDYQDGYPATVNDVELAKSSYEIAKTFLPEDQIVYPGEKAMFGEDFAFYAQKVPGCFVQLGCRNEAKDCVYPLHHPRFLIDEDCMKVGVRLFCSFAGLIDE